MIFIEEPVQRDDDDWLAEELWEPAILAARNEGDFGPVNELRDMGYEPPPLAGRFLEDLVRRKKNKTRGVRPVFGLEEFRKKAIRARRKHQFEERARDAYSRAMTVLQQKSGLERQKGGQDKAAQMAAAELWPDCNWTNHDAKLILAVVKRGREQSN